MRSLALFFVLVAMGCQRGPVQSSPAASRAVSPRPAAPAGDPLAGIVEAHNAVRRRAQPTPRPALGDLKESATLATQAGAWAEHCEFRHSDSPAGENLYASTNLPTAQAVVDSWAREAAAYDYRRNRCSGQCGHYTQMVWRDTARLGCAARQCRRGSPFGAVSESWWLVVCRYEPAGNYVGERPY